VGSLFVFVHGWCCFGLSTFGIRSWTDANNPEWSGEVGAPPHWQPIPLRSIGCQCGEPLLCSGLLQTNLYTTTSARFYNLEAIPAKDNLRKSSKITAREVALARRWHRDGLLTAEGLKAVEIGME
jgi:hypothetical protein